MELFKKMLKEIEGEKKERSECDHEHLEEIQASLFCVECGEELEHKIVKTPNVEPVEKNVNSVARLKSFIGLVKKVGKKVNIEKHIERLEKNFMSLESGFTSSTSPHVKKSFFNLHFVLSKLLERHGVYVSKENGLPKKNCVFEFNNLVRDCLQCEECVSLGHHCEECENYEEWEWRKVDKTNKDECNIHLKKWEEFHYQQGEGERYRLEQIDIYNRNHIDEQARRRVRLQRDYERVEEDEYWRGRYVKYLDWCFASEWINQ